MNECKIYVLRDPNTNAVRYVGRTILDLPSRLIGHKCQRNGSDKSAWMGSLIEQDKEPIIEELETVNGEISPERELYWIEHYENEGCELLNIAKPVKLINTSTRFNGGRMKSEDRKVALTVYVPTSRIEKLGLENIKEMTVTMIEKEYKKKK